MRKGREIEMVAMMVGIVLLMSIQFMPSLAQQECWERIATCIVGVDTNAEIQEECCPIITEEISTELECFCSIKPRLDQNATLANTVSDVLSLCDGIASFNTICSGSAPSPIETPPSSTPATLEPSEDASCWEEITTCLQKNVNRSELEPSLNPDSPAFNVTEFFCCPLMQQAARTEKQCFCAINTVIQENPANATNITLILSACNIASSAASLNNFCQAPSDSPTQSLAISTEGEASSPNPAPVIRPSQGSIDSLNDASLMTTEKASASSPTSTPTKAPPTGKTEAEKGAANKITVIGSLSGLFVIFTYVLLH